MFTKSFTGVTDVKMSVAFVFLLDAHFTYVDTTILAEKLKSVAWMLAAESERLHRQLDSIQLLKGHNFVVSTGNPLMRLTAATAQPLVAVNAMN
jgi:hypothetical protein